MKLVRFGAMGSERPGLIDEAGKLRDLSAHATDLAGDVLSPASLSKIAALDPASLPLVDGSPRLGSPVGGAPKFIAIGLNYADHAAEAGMPIPAEPIVFAAPTTRSRSRAVRPSSTGKSNSPSSSAPAPNTSPKPMR
jgi:2,4-didehydro-3-deoxy-L-rhamnonate hydrolase